ncbi:Hypothetical protein SMAX5B_001297 [Scophthalmus maximus]|uniref:Uncharacterized protein n=1 Tax=Scophthalmus maximus TaxID=52904 RepID=A0A2U9BLZ6_SCOMX|nr:Hypothetical protein SMAX5B_001297 [Scophthalmus maximus]
MAECVTLLSVTHVGRRRAEDRLIRGGGGVDISAVAHTAEGRSVPPQRREEQPPGVHRRPRAAQVRDNASTSGRRRRAQRLYGGQMGRTSSW